jgi:hypothetical protein
LASFANCRNTDICIFDLSSHPIFSLLLIFHPSHTVFEITMFTRSFIFCLFTASSYAFAVPQPAFTAKSVALNMAGGDLPPDLKVRISGVLCSISKCRDGSG